MVQNDPLIMPNRLEKIFGKELALINIKEGEYMKKYNSLDPNGYNTEEVGKIYSQLLKDLSKFYNFEIEAKIKTVE